MATSWLSLCAAYSFDEPDAFDTKALVQCLQALRVDITLLIVLTLMQM